jgi:uncharacterized protein YkwD
MVLAGAFHHYGGATALVQPRESLVPIHGCHWIRISTVLFVGLFAAACSDSTLGPDFDPEVEAFVDIANSHRRSVGCENLSWNADVAAVAQAHSMDMVQRDFFAHDNPDGDSPFDRLTNAGIAYSSAAENIASGYGTAASVLEGWLNSAGHRANLENCGLTQAGVGLLETRWTHLFINP